MNRCPFVGGTLFRRVLGATASRARVNDAGKEAAAIDVDRNDIDRLYSVRLFEAGWRAKQKEEAIPWKKSR
jgi:hypothetical protein